MEDNLRHFPRRRLSPEEGRAAAESFLSLPAEERREKAKELSLDDPEMVLSLLGMLQKRIEGSPLDVKEDADFTYQFLRREARKPPEGIFLFDEREYYLGESARIAATACRHLSRREEARRWIGRAEEAFKETMNSSPNLSKVTYQRLALHVEERRFEEVLEFLPGLTASFEKAGMEEAALKCRYLAGMVLKETDRTTEATKVFEEICQRAAALGSEKLMGAASVTLIHLYAAFGEAEKALSCAKGAAPLLRRLGNRIDLAKLHWGVGDLVRMKGQASCDAGQFERGHRELAAAIESYRSAQSEFKEIGLQADIAALHLVVADLLLELGQDKQARWEIQVALPLIEEYKLVPEGLAALSLLKESLSNHRIDRKALRELHGYFPED